MGETPGTGLNEEISHSSSWLASQIEVQKKTQIVRRRKCKREEQEQKKDKWTIFQKKTV